MPAIVELWGYDGQNCLLSSSSRSTPITQKEVISLNIMRLCNFQLCVESHTCTFSLLARNVKKPSYSEAVSRERQSVSGYHFSISPYILYGRRVADSSKMCVMISNTASCPTSSGAFYYALQRQCTPMSKFVFELCANVGVMFILLVSVTAYTGMVYSPF